MNILEIIEKKKNKLELTKEEINYTINSYLSDEVKDYQMSSLLMAICINGMSDRETLYLTDAYIKSGDILDLSLINGLKIDKHSTGGVGDKTTLIVAPLAASCGVNVLKMSGRGLGHTGGTIDKLESIHGFDVMISEEALFEQMNDINLAIVSQTQNLVPADKKIYSLRDVTGTVSSIALIAASIMSKKIASGADKIVIDLKVGNGALLKEYDDAVKLAHLMIKIGKKYDKEVICLLTDMNNPLGLTIGNSIEVMESIQTLKGYGPKDLEKLCVALATYMVSIGKGISLEEANTMVLTNLKNGYAYTKFKDMVNYQGGDISTLRSASNILEIYSKEAGYIKNIDALILGNIAKNIGAGRIHKDDLIDYEVGIELHYQTGSHVNVGDKLITIHYNDIKVDEEEVLKAYTFSRDKVTRKLIYEVIR